MKRAHSRKRSMKLGFTLIELLVVVAIVAILAAILFPVFARARDKAKEATCLSNIKQIAMSVIQYCDDYDGYGPTRREGGPRGIIPWNEQLGAYGAEWFNEDGSISGAWQCRAGAYTSYYSMYYGRAGYYMANSGVSWGVGESRHPTNDVLICEAGPDMCNKFPAIYANGSIPRPKGYFGCPYIPVSTGHAGGNAEAFFDGHAKIISEDTILQNFNAMFVDWRS